MSKTKLCIVLIFALAAMLLFVGCGQPAVEPQEPDADIVHWPHHIPRVEGTQPEPEPEPESEPEPTPPAPEPPPVQVVEPPEPMRIWTAEETQEMEWPELFAAVVERLANEQFRRTHGRDLQSATLSSVRWFAIMDINMDGAPDLLVGTEGWHSSGWFNVYTIEGAREFLHSATAAEFVYSDEFRMVETERPLRFFARDGGDDIIFSSLSSFAQNTFRERRIVYTNAITLAFYRAVSCTHDRGMDSSVHTHALTVLDNDGRRHVAETTPMPPLLPYFDAYVRENDLRQWPCPIDFGRNSTDPTIVRLVDRALEGFTEIPVTMHEFPRRFSWPDALFTADDVPDVQAWIFEVAALWE